MYPDGLVMGKATPECGVFEPEATLTQRVACGDKSHSLAGPLRYRHQIANRLNAG